jgi:hypothetical protein
VLDTWAEQDGRSIARNKVQRRRSGRKAIAADRQRVGGLAQAYGCSDGGPGYGFVYGQGCAACKSGNGTGDNECVVITFGAGATLAKSTHRVHRPIRFLFCASLLYAISLKTVLLTSLLHLFFLNSTTL